MRKLLIILLMVMGVASMAQNTFPSSGNVGVGISNPVVPFHIYQHGPSALRFERYNHDIYDIRLVGSEGLFFRNSTKGKDVLIFDGLGNITIPGKLAARSGTNPAWLLQDGPKALMFERPGHDLYNIHLAGSEGLYFVNWTQGRVELKFDGLGNLVVPGKFKGENGSTPISILQDGPSGILWERSGHDKYRAYLGGSKGLFFHNDTDGRVEMMFDGHGNIGIGTDAPTEKLEVVGHIRTEGVIVEVINGPDYVFEEDYDLRSLEETSAYIETHKHLPDVPSAKEMESGVELAAMNMKLLEKIEELTLHLIEQNEQLKEAQAQIKVLQSQMAEVNK
jgi:hypothetical protein